jgi:hypothetical protein
VTSGPASAAAANYIAVPASMRVLTTRFFAMTVVITYPLRRSIRRDGRVRDHTLPY